MLKLKVVILAFVSLGFAQSSSGPFLVAIGEQIEKIHCLGTVISPKHILTSGSCGKITGERVFSWINKDKKFHVKTTTYTNDNRLAIAELNDTVTSGNDAYNNAMVALFLSTSYVDTTQCLRTIGSQVLNLMFRNATFEDCIVAKDYASLGCLRVENCVKEEKNIMMGGPVFCRVTKTDYTQFGVFMERKCYGDNGQDKLAFVRFYSLWILATIKKGFV